MNRRSAFARALVAAFLCSFWIAAAVVACRDVHPEPAHVITPAVRAGCILLRAFTASGTVDEVCATAEDLAPLISEIVAVHDANEKRASEETRLPVKPEPLIAFNIAPPKRPQPKRRCAQWVSLVDAGGSDAGP